LRYFQLSRFNRLQFPLRLILIALSTAILLFSAACSAPPVTVIDAGEANLEPSRVSWELEDHVPSGARRLILVIGDGMGAEQLRAASLYKTGGDKGLVLQNLPVESRVATLNASRQITDSAAAGTALSTAVKVQNGAIGVRLPGNGEDLVSITEKLKSKGWGIGLVTTAFMTHATPAAFGSHVASRLNYAAIARDYLTGLRPDLLFGGGGYGMDHAAVTGAGYTVATSREELFAVLDNSRRDIRRDSRIAGLFGIGHFPYIYDGRPEDFPGLVEMAEAAVDFLASREEGFFLMIEGARIDHAGHDNDVSRLIPEVLEVDATVEMLLNHPLLQEDTLLVVTADHETGGLTVTGGKGVGRDPAVTWSTTGHTGVEVPLFASGMGAEAFVETLDNTLVRSAMLSALKPGGPEGELALTTILPAAEEARVQ
jgi:alkaline phosphatase